MNTKSQKSPSKAWIFIDLVAVLLLLLTAFFAFRFYHQDSDLAMLESNIKAQLGQLDDKTNEEIQASLNEVVAEGNLSISINANPIFPTGDSAGSLKIENGPQNLYGQEVSITLDDTGEEIYNSGYMPINSHIQEDVLSVDLPAGDYKATVTFTALDESPNHAVVGQAIAQIRISILA